MASDVQEIIDSIVRSLPKESGNENHFLSQVNEIAQKKGTLFYRALLYVLTHLDFSEEEACEHWKRISDHVAEMSRKLERPVSFRVAIVDYFISIDRRIENPKIIEIESFEAIERLTYIDPLTGLNNRRFLDQALKREISLAGRRKTPFSIIILDLDFFKNYNDEHGHIAGDDALRLIACRLRDSLRAEDLAVRYGGEEFLLILPRTSRRGALAIGERFRKLIESIDPGDPSNDLKGPLTISGGIATYPQDGEDEKQLLQNADNALYKAKNEGRNTTCFYTPERRRFVRIDLICPIRYQLVEPIQGKKQSVSSRNVSEGGLLFAVRKQIPLHAVVKVELRIPESKQAINFFGEVVRIEKGTSRDEPYLVGLSFMKFDREEQNLLVDYVKRKI